MMDGWIEKLVPGHKQHPLHLALTYPGSEEQCQAISRALLHLNNTGISPFLLWHCFITLKQAVLRAPLAKS